MFGLWSVGLCWLFSSLLVVVFWFPTCLLFVGVRFCFLLWLGWVVVFAICLVFVWCFTVGDCVGEMFACLVVCCGFDFCLRICYVLRLGVIRLFC